MAGTTVARADGPADTPPSGRIGPNAIIRTAEALAAHVDAGTRDRIFADAGLAAYLTSPPDAMVAEAEVVALHRAVRATLAPAVGDAVMRDAGARTARYLLAHRIPRPAQGVLRVLPARLAARALLALIARHAWTFAGTAEVRVEPGRPATVTFRGSPFARLPDAVAPACGFYAATFEVLFRELVHPASRAVETRCAATGAEFCEFRLSW